MSAELRRELDALLAAIAPPKLADVDTFFQADLDANRICKAIERFYAMRGQTHDEAIRSSLGQLAQEICALPTTQHPISLSEDSDTGSIRAVAAMAFERLVDSARVSATAIEELVINLNSIRPVLSVSKGPAAIEAAARLALCPPTAVTTLCAACDFPPELTLSAKAMSYLVALTERSRTTPNGEEFQRACEAVGAFPNARVPWTTESSLCGEISLRSLQLAMEPLDESRCFPPAESWIFSTVDQLLKEVPSGDLVAAYASPDGDERPRGDHHVWARAEEDLHVRLSVLSFLEWTRELARIPADQCFDQIRTLLSSCDTAPWTARQTRDAQSGTDCRSVYAWNVPPHSKVSLWDDHWVPRIAATKAFSAACRLLVSQGRQDECRTWLAGPNTAETVTTLLNRNPRAAARFLEKVRQPGVSLHDAWAAAQRESESWDAPYPSRLALSTPQKPASGCR